MKKKRTADEKKFKAAVILLTSCILLVLIGIALSIPEEEEVPEIVSLRDQASALNFPEERKELPYLRKKAQNNAGVLKVLLQYPQYPKALTAFLTINPAQLRFVNDYPKKIHEPYREITLGKSPSHTVPLLIQWDSRWAYMDLGDDCIAINGCGPTSLSMVYSGLTGDRTKTPAAFSQFVNKNDYYSNNVGCKWSLMSDGASAFGLKSHGIPPNDSALVFSELQQGHPIICSVKKGDFTFGGHFIVLSDVTKDGKIKVNDPNSPWKSLLLWDYERIKPQVAAMWSYSL